MFVRRATTSIFAVTSTYTLYKNRDFIAPRMLAFAQPTVTFADELLRENNHNSPYLGCSLRSQMDKPGMMVLLVNSEAPAWVAHMKVGDVLLEIDGAIINKIADYRAAVAGKHN